MSVRAEAWQRYDDIVRTAEQSRTNPWMQAPSSDLVFEPDFDTLASLLAVPVELGAASQSGVPALALDVWVAYELRRAGFDPDLVWPRRQVPRFLPSEIAVLRTGMTRAARDDLDRRLAAGSAFNGAVSATANILGKNYVKQVDVGISRWNTGPELMISTKRMDSSFAKNAANRVEESYGDAKNLRLRHPLAALGFFYGLRSTALTEEPDKTEWLQDLLIKLGREEDAYDAVALIVPEWDAVPEPVEAELDPPEDDPLVAAGLTAPPDPSDDVAADDAGSLADGRTPARPTDDVPIIRLRHDAVPEHLQPARAFAILIGKLLDNCPINFHTDARAARNNPRPAGPGPH